MDSEDEINYEWVYTPFIIDEPKVDSCLHESCSECSGSGINKSGRPCVHGISCPCSKCSPY